MKKLSTVQLDIPYKGPGNVIRQREVEFELYQVDGHYSLVPCLNDEERRIANLPGQLNFTIEEGRPRSLRGDIDGNFHVISDAVEKLQLIKNENR